MDSPVQTLEAIQPLVCNKIYVPGSDLSFSAACFEGDNWSLGPLQQPRDVEKNHDLALRVDSALHGLGAKRAFAPNPTKFNAEVINEERLNRELVLPSGIPLYRNQDIPADGTLLREPGDAGIFSAGGCSAVVATFRGNMIFAHAGRDCVLDRTHVETEGRHRGRKHESVAHSIIEYFGVHTRDKFEDLHVWVFYSIKPKDFMHRDDDPTHGDFNKKLKRYAPIHFGEFGAKITSEGVAPDVPEMLHFQLTHEGVPARNVHLNHAYLADELPHTRKGDGKGRYLVAIVRHS